MKYPSFKRRISEKIKKGGDSSAHPSSSDYDPTYAQGIMGKISEQVRQFLVNKYEASPPGLQTVTNSDGSIEVIADCPEVGLGLSIKIETLKNPSMGNEENQSPLDSGLGIGPPTLDNDQPLSPNPQSPLDSGLGIGPPPNQPLF